MGINLGSSTPGNFRLGDTQVNSIWLGNTKVWPLAIAENYMIGGASCYVGDPFSFDPTSTSITGSDIYYIFNDDNSSFAGDDAFANCFNLTTASFTAMKNVGFRTFADCTSLVSASFPNALTLAFNAFEGCTSLVSASLEKVNTIGVRAYENCTSLSYLNFPNCGVIYAGAFKNCTSLVSASFPNLLTFGTSSELPPPNPPMRFSDLIFENCTSLSYISLPKLSGSFGLGDSTGSNNVFLNVPNNG